MTVNREVLRRESVRVRGKWMRKGSRGLVYGDMGDVGRVKVESMVLCLRTGDGCGALGLIEFWMMFSCFSPSLGLFLLSPVWKMHQV